MIDSDGFRPNVGIIITDDSSKVLWAKRIGQDSWQFPQGGINDGEDPRDALYRELQEEVGLLPSDVEIVAVTSGWLRYKLPKHCIRHGSKPLCIGQKQKWFLLKLCSDECNVSFGHYQTPEFDGWRWVDYWEPLRDVIYFKRKVYKKALSQLAKHVLPKEQQQVPGWYDKLQNSKAKPRKYSSGRRKHNNKTI